MKNIKDLEKGRWWRFKVWFMKVLASALTFLAFELRLYPIWSKIYQWFWHRQLSNPKSASYVPLDENLGVVEAQNYMDLVEWQADGPRELWDAFGSPHWFQHVLNEVRSLREQPEGANDCDEFAIWAANVLDEKYRPRILTVTWVRALKNDKGKYRLRIGGHNVCIVKIDKPEGGVEYRHLGNWGLSHAYDSSYEVVADIARRALGRNEVVRWALWEKDLSLLQTSRRVRNITF